VAVCAIHTGLRIVVRTGSHHGLRPFVRRLFAYLAVRLGYRGVRWRSEARVARIALNALATYLRYIARCRAMMNGGVGMSKARKNGGASIVRTAVRLLRVIEKANDALLGADEAAARIRRYVASHEAPANDQAAFERLCETIFAQRIGFEAVAKNHDTLGAAFRNFAPHVVAQMRVSDVARMLDEPAVRDRSKVEACLECARLWQVVAAEDGTYLG